ncbi:MAG: hypothetical protein M3373_09365 [Gemmatimonadota bacterium]|nr:hypothetical protein [Gemmatimonadota bacterium]
MPIHVTRLASSWWRVALVSLATLGMHCGSAPEAGTQLREEATSLPSARAERSLQVRGQFEADGSALRRVHPLRIVARKASLQHRSAEGMFRLSVVYMDGSDDAVRFDAYIADDSDPGRREFGSFTVELALPESATLKKVTLTDAAGRREFVSWTGTQLPK